MTSGFVVALPLVAAVRRPSDYTRFSSKNQDERTIADQQRDCRARAARDGFEIPPELEFSDEAISGAKRARAGFEKMLAAARAGRISVLYIVNLSRLARDSVLTMQTLRELVYVHHVRVISLDEGIDTASSQSWELIVAIYGVLHEQFLKKLSQDVFRGQRGVVMDNYAVGDHCLGIGTEPVPGTERGGKGRGKEPLRRYMILWSEMQWVLSIFVWFVNDRRSLRWIARELNRLGAPKDHRATTKEWTHQLVTSVLKNEKYIGRWHWGKHVNVRDPMDGSIRQQKRPLAEYEQWFRHFPELQAIDDATFAKVQELLEQNAEAHGKRRRENGQLHGSTSESRQAHPQHPLSGLIECACCGRHFNVGGKNGKYLFCRGYAMGVCTCQTTLRRDLAETLIYKTVSDYIVSDPTLIDLLLAQSTSAYEQVKRERPSRLQAVTEQLAHVEKRIASIVANCEREVVPELEARMAELRVDRDRLQAEQKQLRADEESQPGPPTREWIMERLTDLRSILNGHGPATAHALRDLVGGKIVVTEVRLPGKKRHYLRGRLELRLRTVAVAAGIALKQDSDVEPDPVEVVEIDFRLPPPHLAIAEEAKRLWDTGMKIADIAQELNCGRVLVTNALKHWYEQHGEPHPDFRACKKRFIGRRKAQKLEAEIMQLWHDELSITAIAERLNCGLDVVREAVTNWYQARNLPVPDGRARRREIRLKRREAG